MIEHINVNPGLINLWRCFSQRTFKHLWKERETGRSKNNNIGSVSQDWLTEPHAMKLKVILILTFQRPHSHSPCQVSCIWIKSSLNLRHFIYTRHHTYVSLLVSYKCVIQRLLSRTQTTGAMDVRTTGSEWTFPQTAHWDSDTIRGSNNIYTYWSHRCIYTCSTSD